MENNIQEKEFLLLFSLLILCLKNDKIKIINIVQCEVKDKTIKEITKEE
jgi:hypothetical protein